MLTENLLWDWLTRQKQLTAPPCDNLDGAWDHVLHQSHGVPEWPRGHKQESSDSHATNSHMIFIRLLTFSESCFCFTSKIVTPSCGVVGV
jgi:hypothetical protein